MTSGGRQSSEPPWPEGQVPPVEDPAADLSPTARRILAAARRVLARDGFAGLTFEAISAEAGENKSAIRYYFGGKAGLITTLVDWIDHDDSARLIRELSADHPDLDRIGVLLRIQQEGSKYVKDSQLFFDLLPHVLRDRKLRSRLGELYAWYRDLDRWALAPDVDERTKGQVESLAALGVAVSDGISMQYAADPRFDADAAFATWERLLRSALRELGVRADGESGAGE
jgi:AcrR family transcriptional regulator